MPESSGDFKRLPFAVVDFDTYAHRKHWILITFVKIKKPFEFFFMIFFTQLTCDTVPFTTLLVVFIWRVGECYCENVRSLSWRNGKATDSPNPNQSLHVSVGASIVVEYSIHVIRIIFSFFFRPLSCGRIEITIKKEILLNRQPFVITTIFFIII